jgi:hypothetical protein
MAATPFPLPDRGIPVRAAHAAYVRMALQKLTRVPYTASIVIRPVDIEAFLTRFR